MISQNKQVSGSLGAAVRRARMNRSFFRKEQVGTIKRQVAVDFVRAYLMVALDAVFTAGIHQNRRPHDVRFKEKLRIFDRRTRPSFFTCMLFAAGSTLSFIVFLKIMNLFINVNKYNVIYGVLSNTIVLLMEVFFFFIIFLFFAQWLFVFQFFDTLLLCELYLLPARDETSLADLSKRLLFIRPDYLLKNELNTIRLKKGDNVYSTGQVGKDAFYVSKGTVRITRLNHVSFADRGCFFGEEACMLRELRNEDATAWTDAEIVRIPEETFFMILDKNPRAASKALSRISNYFAKFYGLTKEYPL